ncbi:MAG: hypothetical protein D6701_02665, partial [Gemmatimonadetes bacterium]
FQAWPFASVYLGPEGQIGGEARERIAGFWKAVGQEPPAEPDHLAALLGLYCSLREAAADAEHPAQGRLLQRAARVCLEEHVATWVFVFTDVVRSLGEPFYAAWATLLDDVLARVFAEGGTRWVSGGGDARDGGDEAELPVALRGIPRFDLPDAPDSAAAFLDALLAPARTGFVITRETLRRGAQTLGLGLRQGERRYVLESLLGQDAAGVLAFLAGEAEGWTARHRIRSVLMGPVAHWWESRAQHAARVLAEAAASAGRGEEAS